jgi:26S proteasome regulatory subunit N1
MKNHEEPEAVDLLAEVEQLDKLIPLCTENNYKRLCLYLVTNAPYAADQEDMQRFYLTAFNCYMKLDKYPDALLIAQKLQNQDLIDQAMNSC